jgi:hypothetical protein
MTIFEAGVFHRLATAGSFKSGPFFIVPVFFPLSDNQPVKGFEKKPGFGFTGICPSPDQGQNI